jgi:hypothetical protein
VNYQEDYGQYQKQVDCAACDMERSPSDQPANSQHDKQHQKGSSLQ